MTTDAKSHATNFLILGLLHLIMTFLVEEPTGWAITLVVGSVLVGASSTVLFSDKVISYLENKKYKRVKKIHFKYH